MFRRVPRLPNQQIASRLSVLEKPIERPLKPREG